MRTTTNSTFIHPGEFHINEFIEISGEYYLVLNEKMIVEHFAFQVAALKWDFEKNGFEKNISRVILPGHKDYRVFGTGTRMMFGLSETPYDSLAWQRFDGFVVQDWHNDPKHNDLP